MYCPIMSFQKEYRAETLCMGQDCAWADANGDCLIKKALMKYIGKNDYIEESYKRQPVMRINYEEYLKSDNIPF